MKPNVRAPDIRERFYDQVRLDVDRADSIPGVRFRFIELAFHNFRVRRLDGYPLIELLVEFTESGIIKCAYEYKATSTGHTREWSKVLSLKASDGDWNLVWGERTFLDEREASQFLLQPLIDTNFTPP